MKINEIGIEEFLHKDGMSIEINQEHKRNLKKKIMAGQARSHPMYYKASLQVAAALLAVTVFGGGIAMVAKQDTQMQIVTTTKEGTSLTTMGIAMMEKKVPIMPVVNPAELSTTTIVEPKVTEPVVKEMPTSKPNTETKFENTQNTVEPTKTGKEENPKPIVDVANLPTVEKPKVDVKPEVKDPNKDLAIGEIAKPEDKEAEKREVASVPDGQQGKKEDSIVIGEGSIKFLDAIKVTALPEGCVYSSIVGTKKLVPYITEEIEAVVPTGATKEPVAENHYAVVGVTDEATGEKQVLLKLGPLTKENNKFQDVFWSKDGKVIYVLQKTLNPDKPDILKLNLMIK